MTGYPGPQVSLDLESIIDGHHDAALIAIAQQLHRFGRQLFLRFAHEMNSTWYPWAEDANGNRPGQYGAAWQHVHDLIAPIAGTLIEWVWSPNIVSGVPPSAPTYRELFPGNAYVDYVGLTGYEHSSSAPATTFSSSIAELRALTGKPIILSEIGVTGHGKQDWLRGLGSYVESVPAIAGFVYFNTSTATTKATGNYGIDSVTDAAALSLSLKAIGLG